MVMKHMDVVYLDSGMKEQGVLADVVFECEIGNENGFTLTVTKSDYKKVANCFVYPVGAVEFGGKVTSCISNSENGYVTFAGKTWIGLLGLNSAPYFNWSPNSSRLLSTYLSDVLAPLNQKVVPITTYTMPSAPEIVAEDGKPVEYYAVYDGLMKQAERIPVFSAAYAADGSVTIQIDTRVPVEYDSLNYSSDVIPVEVEKQFQPVTMVTICAKNPNTGNWYVPKVAKMVSDGVWEYETSTPSPYVGLYSRRVGLVLSVEEYTNPDWSSIIDSVQVKDAATIRLAGELTPDVGDTVTSRDETTGITATAKVTSKTLHISDGVPIFSFDTAQGV